MGEARVAEIYRYPVKGLSAQQIKAADLTPGDGVPGDRVLALALPDTEFDEANPVALSKQRFLMLQRDERLARVRTDYDPGTGRLVVDDGTTRLAADVATPEGRLAVEEFFGALAAPSAGTSGTAAERRPRLVTGRGGHRFTDAGVSGPEFMQAISIMNLASVRDFEARVGQPVNPLRFRANFHVEGLAPWVERDWVGQVVTLGEVRVRVLSDIGRCAATMVNPDTAERDLRVLKDLQTHYGHMQVGSYATVLTAGTVRTGDPVVLAAG